MGDVMREHKVMDNICNDYEENVILYWAILREHNISLIV